MKLNKLLSLVVAVGAFSFQAQADIITLTDLNARTGGSGGISGLGNVSFDEVNTLDGSTTVTADPLNIIYTVTGVDIDGDATANDSFTFTLQATGGTNQRIWGQGIDSGFGSLNGITFSVTSVTGTATDSGFGIQFDGFTGVGVGLGGNGDFQRNVDAIHNGTTNTFNLTTLDTGGFEFIQDSVDFAVASTLLLDNSGGTGGSIVGRTYDLQFSTIPEPSTFSLFALAGAILALRRRK